MSPTTDLLEINAVLLGQMTVGFVAGKLHLFDEKGLNIINKFVFKVCFPCMAFRGLAKAPLALSDAKFVLGYIILCYMLLGSVLVVLKFNAWRARGKGVAPQPLNMADVATNWLGMGWPNSVILGQPVITALFGEEWGNYYPFLHMLGSLLLGVPGYTALFEVQRERIQMGAMARECVTEEGRESDAECVSPVASVPDAEGEGEREGEGEGVPSVGVEVVCPDVQTEEGEAEAAVSDIKPPVQTDGGDDAQPTEDVPQAQSFRAQSFRAQSFRTRLLKSMFMNPLIVSILLGFAVNLLGWGENLYSPLDSLLAGFATVAGTGGIFNIGLFGALHLRNLSFKLPLVYCFVKLMVNPLVMMGLATVMGMSRDEIVASTFLASMPLALSSFSLVTEYSDVQSSHLGQGVITPTLVLGCVLMVPTQVLLQWFISVVLPEK
ncbi:auxin efflux carrier [Kipferlia bialata]|uniref:Auxin efflux carrier n=1 Tax=Kipferlia bialata TaxID=797122 RepID=A0A9K3D5T3_9EUKA|nr:auxin efflux carrier [Kipferlia bialata]|eukprot:g9946.t1